MKLAQKNRGSNNDNDASVQENTLEKDRDGLSSSQKSKALFILISLILTTITMSVLLYNVSPQEIVSYIGVNNSYLLMFIAALIGGVSSFTAPSYFALLFTLANGGTSPLLLGLSGGFGIFLSDIFFYYIGYNGRELVRDKSDRLLAKLESWIADKPDWVPPLASYIYTGFTLLPNDILMLTLALSKISLRRVILAILVGSLQLSVILAYLFSSGLFAGFFS